MNTTIIVVSVCLAIYAVFSYLEVNAREISVEIDKALLDLYGKEMLPHIIEGVTTQISDRLMRYYFLLNGGGLTTRDEFEESIKKAGNAYYEEFKGD